MNNGVAIAGWSALRVGKYMPGPGARTGVNEADRFFPVIRDALAMAGIEPGQVGAALFASAPDSDQLGMPVYMSARIGLKCRSMLAEVGLMGISGGLAFDMAAAEIQLGRADYALALGLSYQTGERAPILMERGNRVVGDVNFQSVFGVTPICWYGMDAHRYLFETGQSREDLAAIAIKSRKYARLNPLAQFRTPLHLDEVLEAPMVVDPLGLYDVPQGGDGAICLVLAREDLVSAKGAPYARLAGRGFCHDGLFQMGDRAHDMTDFPAARAAVNECLKSAASTLEQIDLFELYAPCTITEALVTEAIGLFARGEGCKAARNGISGPGGPRPVNTSGGCLARGHPPALTGLYGLLECAEQVTRQASARQVAGARRGLSVCEGGNYNLALAHVIERAEP